MFQLDEPVTIERVQIHQNPKWPIKKLEVLASQDDGVTWTSVAIATLPEVGPLGPNFAYWLATDLAECATQIKLSLLEGYRAERWGLGEVEVFGTGATMRTDDDWYHVNADLTGLTAGATYHHRVVATSAGRTFYGPDVTFQVPLDAKPQVDLHPASRIAGGSAKLEGRINTLGREAEVYFEYGPDPTYGYETKRRFTGPEITPRTVVALVEGLTPGESVHYRLVVSGPGGTTKSDGATFVAR